MTLNPYVKLALSPGSFTGEKCLLIERHHITTRFVRRFSSTIFPPTRTCAHSGGGGLKRTSKSSGTDCTLACKPGGSVPRTTSCLRNPGGNCSLLASPGGKWPRCSTYHPRASLWSTSHSAYCGHVHRARPSLPASHAHHHFRAPSLEHVQANCRLQQKIQALPQPRSFSIS
jgi:hypothetical protein